MLVEFPYIHRIINKEFLLSVKNNRQLLYPLSVALRVLRANGYQVEACHCLLDVPACWNTQGFNLRVHTTCRYIIPRPINSNLDTWYIIYAGNMNFLMSANCPQLRLFYFGYFHHVLMFYAVEMFYPVEIVDMAHFWQEQFLLFRK